MSSTAAGSSSRSRSTRRRCRVWTWRAIGIRKTRRNGEVDPYIALYGGRRTLIYAFCGLGRNCAVQEKASDGIDRLLRRAALEVALYSFKYLDRVESTPARRTWSTR
jgi:hypothetical protein